jgi:hypothetical protein
MGPSRSGALLDANLDDPIRACHESASWFTQRQYRICQALSETTDDGNGLLAFDSSPFPPILRLTGAASVDRSK